jgi:hypothetical protein
LVCDTLPEDLLQFVGSESLVCAHCKSGAAIPKALNASTMKMAAAKAMAMIGRAALAKNLHIADLSPVEPGRSNFHYHWVERRGAWLAEASSFANRTSCATDWRHNDRIKGATFDRMRARAHGQRVNCWGGRWRTMTTVALQSSNSSPGTKPAHRTCKLRRVSRGTLPGPG